MSKKKPAVPPTPADPGKVKVKLSIKDRIQFSGLFQQSASYVDHVIQADISAKVKIGQKEISAIGMRAQTDKQGNVGYIWDAKKDAAISVEFTGAEAAMIQRAIQRVKGSKQTLISADLFEMIRRLEPLFKPEEVKKDAPDPDMV